tara:strand:- start:112 stop:552 length:441 start_codon:yes stop_codon:yes gene_type:complete
MTKFEQAIEKLLRRIERAQSKGKQKKAERLTKELHSVMDSYQKQHEQHIQELEVLAFEHDDEQSKDNKELVSVTPSQVGNEIGATFWENEQELPSNLGSANNSEQQSNGADSSNDLHDNPTLEQQEREDIDINEEREEEEEEEEDE